MAGGLISGGPSGLGALFTGSPSYSPAPLDQGTQNLIGVQQRTAEDITPQTMANNDLGANGSGSPISRVFTPTQPTNTMALGGASDPNMQAALQARASRTMAGSVNQLQRQAQVAGQGQAAGVYQNAMNSSVGAQNVNNQINQAQIQAATNNQQTRNSLISGLFGAAGSVAGFMGGGAGNVAGITQSQAATGDAALMSAPDGDVDLQSGYGSNGWS